MDDARAHELLSAERTRIEEGLGHTQDPVEGDIGRVPGDVGDEGLYQDSFDQGRREDLQRQLASVERAEKRLSEGTYGRSVRSGETIPDARLEAFPTAELTVEEQRAENG